MYNKEIDAFGFSMYLFSSNTVLYDNMGPNDWIHKHY